MARSFVSYASEYDMHMGNITINDLSREQQDELIRLVFDPNGDHQEFVIANNLEHFQPDGLWTIVVALGTLLERKRVIKDFMSRSDEDRDWIINMLAGTRLWLRLEEAFPPFDRCYRQTEYDWSEIETFGARDAIAEMIDDAIGQRLIGFLEKVPEPADGIYRRLSYQDYVREWEESRLVFFVDRGMAVQAYRFSDSVWANLPSVFLLGLIAFIPVMIFVGFLWGLSILAIAVSARKLLTTKAVSWVRKDALASRRRYRWFSAHSVIWAKKG